MFVKEFIFARIVHEHIDMDEVLDGVEERILNDDIYDLEDMIRDSLDDLSGYSFDADAIDGWSELFDYVAGNLSLEASEKHNKEMGENEDD